MKALLRWPLLLLGIGALSPLAFAPYSLFWLPFLQFTALLICIERLKSISAFKLGFAFGLGWFTSGVSWVHVSIDQFGGLPFPVPWALMLILGGYLALFTASATWLSSRFSFLTQSRILLFAPAWALVEWVRSWLFTGFPWLSVGYAQLDGPFASLIPIVGEYGVSVIWALSVTILALVIAHRAWFLKFPAQLMYPVIGLSCIGIASFIASQYSWVKPAAANVKIALIQGNIEQENRWAPENMWPTMLKYLDMSRPYYQKSDIILWPEAAVPAVEKYANDYLEQLDSALNYAGASLVTGVVDYNFDSKEYFNSLIALGKQYPEDTQGHYEYGHANRYAKHHLLPIGEFVPFEDWLRPLAPFFDLPHSSFSRGQYVQHNIVANGYHLLPAICYEIVFPMQIKANMTSQTDFILTVSNDAWFGDSVGPHQHLQIARMRAAEFAIPVIRVTNNGITAIIGPEGNLIQVAPQFEDGIIEHDLQLNKVRTPFFIYGNLPIILCLMVGVFLVIVTSLIKKKKLAKSQDTGCLKSHEKAESNTRHQTLNTESRN